MRIAYHGAARSLPLAAVPVLPTTEDLDSGRPSTEDRDRVLEGHRRELTGYCYRMLGSGAEAEDAVQETMIRAWRNIDSFEGRSALRSWLYRIAHNVCLDQLRGRQRRARPMDLGPSAPADSALGSMLPEHEWIQPIADDRVLPVQADPAELSAARESVRLAFVAALQHLPPQQRAVLILREVLRWKATEVAELLATSVPAVNSALQRARATLAGKDIAAGDGGPTADTGLDAQRDALLARYVEAFERYDITELVSLIHEDATFTMPPFPLWLEGTEEIGRFYLGQGIGCEGSRLLATSANGCPAFGAYKKVHDGLWEPWAIQVIESSDGAITGLHHFLYPALFADFGLPPRIEA
ncbi:MAG: polymerase, sigma-24 subunit, subfamily [Acidimicrobiales bacterium]|nr:polymerase, sigma-24 subunit, subfamily [Acidimicrobiales bacterium]